MSATLPCPGCAEPLAPGTPRCFRCETRLERWWELDARFAEIEEGGPPEGIAVATRPTSEARLRPAWIVPTLAAAALGLLLGAGAGRVSRTATEGDLEHARLRPVAPAQPTAASPAAPPLGAGAGVPGVCYTVQPGDSAWRIASALLGDGRRWREVSQQPLLKSGQTLAVGPVAGSPGLRAPGALSQGPPTCWGRP